MLCDEYNLLMSLLKSHLFDNFQPSMLLENIETTGSKLVGTGSKINSFFKEKKQFFS